MMSEPSPQIHPIYYMSAERLSIISSRSPSVICNVNQFPRQFELIIIQVSFSLMKSFLGARPVSVGVGVVARPPRGLIYHVVTIFSTHITV